MEEKKNTLTVHKAKKKKRRIIVTISLILVVAIVGFAIYQRLNVGNEAVVVSRQTGMIAKQDLVSSVGATGTVISVTSQDLSVPLSNIDVSTIAVSVGDSVTTGDVLVEFDTSDLEDNLTEAESSLSTAEAQQGISEENAARNLEDAQRSANYQISNSATNLANAQSAYVSASDTYNAATTKLSKLKDTESSAKEDYESAKETYESTMETDANYEMVKAAYESAKTVYETAKSERKAYEATVDELHDALLAASDSYNTALKEYDNTVANQESSVASAESSSESASLSDSTTSAEQQVQNAQEQLDAATLTAPFDGVITSISLEEGDTYTGGTILTLQDYSNLEIQAQISQYDIADIELGQEVLIKTDATGDEELSGTVTYISPASSSTTTSTTSTTATDATYTVKITLSEQNERLRLGMSANLSIIKEEHVDVLTVPYNAVMTDTNGDTYIEVVEMDTASTTDAAASATRKINVEVVMESSYYSEISSDEIAEGMTVVVSDASSTSSDEMQFTPGAGGRGGAAMGGGF
ncbi:MAG: HlyD family secretion protein [Lachnospiraceae bacterium]